MKQTLRFLGIVGLVAAFALMAVAMVLPHSHDADTAQHACWICHSKAVGVSAPEVSPQPAVLHRVSIAVLVARPFFESKTSFLLFDSRAPPVFSPVLS